MTAPHALLLPSKWERVRVVALLAPLAERPLADSGIRPQIFRAPRAALLIAESANRTGGSCGPSAGL